MKYTKILLMAASLMAATACSNYTDIDLFDSPLADGGQGTLAVDHSTVSMLTFTWQPVAGVCQYGYKLINPLEQTVRQGVTSETTMTFERLEAATAYRFEIEAYGANQEVTTRFTIEASTPAYVQLATPDVAAMAMDLSGGVVTVSWQPVEHAASYEYVLSVDGGVVVQTGTTEATSVEFGVLEAGVYTMELQAMTDEEGYLMSDIVCYDFEIEQAGAVTYEGVYTSYLKGDYPARLTVYDDGRWVLESFYGVEGYDLEMSVDEEEGPVTILNAFSEWGDYRYVYTGLDGDDYYAVMYQDPSYCCFYEDEDGSLVLMFYLFLGADAEGGFDYFRWTE